MAENTGILPSVHPCNGDTSAGNWSKKKDLLEELSESGNISLDYKMCQRIKKLIFLKFSHSICEFHYRIKYNIYKNVNNSRIWKSKIIC